MTKLLGVMGWPIAHTASPAMMTAAFAAMKEDAVYLPFAVRPEDFADAVRGLRALGAVGANVTLPHKQTAWRIMDSLTPEAELAHAVNTISFDAAGLRGHNTDVEGWWASVAAQLAASESKSLEPLSVAIFGSGGATRAVLAALTLHRPASRVVIIARNRQHAEELAESFEHSLEVSVVDWSHRHETCSAAGLLVNSTPVGMWPHPDASVISDSSCVEPRHVVQDMVYRPRQTELLRQAAERGATVVEGLSMLVHQGAAALTYWLHQPAPVDVMWSAAEDYLRLH